MDGGRHKRALGVRQGTERLREEDYTPLRNREAASPQPICYPRSVEGTRHRPAKTRLRSAPPFELVRIAKA
jgi:hypothetical protein